MVFCSTLGALASFLLGLMDPKVVNKAGPDWLWMGGRDDIVRNLFFKPNGAFRRYGFVAVLATLVSGAAALLWIVQRLGM
jgi:hypothetical protein